MDINRVVIVGRLTRESELKQTTSGKSLCKFSIAVSGYKDEVGFFDCIAWGTTAETIAKYVQKGKRIGIDGSLKFSSWVTDNKRQSKVEINVDTFQFLDSKQTDSPDKVGELTFSKESMTDDDIAF